MDSVTTEQSRPSIENWETFQARFKDRYPPGFNDWRKISFAYDIAKRAHKGVNRKSGERYFEHPRQVAVILMDECGMLDPDIIGTALLHDVVEDATLLGHMEGSTYSQWKEEARWRMEQIFGSRVAEMVIALTKPRIDGREINNREEMMATYTSQLRTASPGALIVKMADRLHNLRTIGSFEPDRAQRKIDETTSIYVPMFTRAQVAYPDPYTHLITEIGTAIDTYGQGQQLS